MYKLNHFFFPITQLKYIITISLSIITMQFNKYVLIEPKE